VVQGQPVEPVRFTPASGKLFLPDRSAEYHLPFLYYLDFWEETLTGDF
jgi:hypothetical protein